MFKNIQDFLIRINDFFKDLVTIKFEGYDYKALEAELNNLKKEFSDLLGTLLNQDQVTNREELDELLNKYNSL